MVTVVRTPEDVARLLAGGREHPTEWADVRFENTRIEVACAVGLDYRRILKARAALERLMQRVFAQLRHGVPNTSKLSDAERQATTVKFEQSSDGKRVAFDLAAPLNAIMGALPGLSARTLALVGSSIRRPRASSARSSSA